MLFSSVVDNDRIEIFDLDGTLTEEFSLSVGDKTGSGLSTYSFWNLITSSLVVDKAKFDQTAIGWKRMVTTTKDIDKIKSSQEMTELGLSMFKDSYKNADAVQKKAAEITKLFYAKGIIIKDSIEYLKHRLSNGVLCVISTASYEEGARGFVTGLVECRLLPKNLADRIICSGTIIDWKSLKVIHMNAEAKKIQGLELALKQTMKEVQPKIQAVFGDDPAINDRGLLDGLCKYSFVISTVKNQNMQLPVNCVFSTWPEILKHKDRLTALHGKLKSSSQTCYFY